MLEKSQSPILKTMSAISSYVLAVLMFLACNVVKICQATRSNKGNLITSGISCPYKGESGTVVYYIGSSNVHMENRRADENYRVLCVNNTSIATISNGTIQTTVSSATDHVTNTPPLRISSTISSAFQTSSLSAVKYKITKSTTIGTKMISTYLGNRDTYTLLLTGITPTITSLSLLSTTSQIQVKPTMFSIKTTTAAVTSILPSKTTNLHWPETRSASRKLSDQGQTWITIGLEKYFVNINPLDYNSATSFCSEKMNSSLVMFLDPLRYFTLLRQIGLQNKSYWVGSHGFDKGKPLNDCLSYCGINMILTTSPCQTEKMSVCSKSISVGNVSQLLENLEFKNMIRKMSVLKNETGQQLRKLSCAKDARATAKATGFTGLFLLCAVSTLMVLADVLRLISNFKKR